MFSYLPRRQRVTTVGKIELELADNPSSTLVGAPIVVQAILDPSSAEIDRLHQEYLQSVEQLFETQKVNYGFGHVSLQLI